MISLDVVLSALYESSIFGNLFGKTVVWIDKDEGILNTAIMQIEKTFAVNLLIFTHLDSLTHYL